MLIKSLQGAGGSTVPPISFQYQTTTGSDSNSSSYTFSNVAIGTAAADRYVVVVATVAQGTGGLLTIDTVSIAGTNGTISVNQRDGTNSASCNAAIASRLVTTGTTATIVVGLSSSARSCYISVYNVYGLTSATATNTYSSTTDPLSFSNVNFDAGGFIVSGGIQRGVSSTSTWTELTENYDSVSAETETRTAASFAPISNSTKTVTCDFTTAGTQGRVGVLASWSV